MSTRPKKVSTGRIAAGNTDDMRTKKANKKKKVHGREKLDPGFFIYSEKGKYKVIELLGSGGFGDVYKVEDMEGASSGSLYAMKTEQNESYDKRMLRLKMETRVLTDCNEREGPSERKRHFLKMVDRGRTNKFKYVLMGLVGPSITDLRKDFIKDEKFSKGNSLQMAIQTLESVWFIHEVGYIHRDIKPQNFAIGLGEREDTIYMLDFGIARRFIDIVDGKRTVRAPRDRAKFIGTIRFASRRCHTGREQGRMDDLEVWIYMVIDLFDAEGLPWRRVCDRTKVLAMKLQFFDFHFRHALKYVTEDFREIVKYVDRLEYEEDPNYQKIIDILHKIGDDHNMDYRKKFRWVGKIEALKKKKKEREAKEKEKEKEDDEASYDMESDEDEDDEESESDRPKKKSSKKPNSNSKKPSSRSLAGKKPQGSIMGRSISKKMPGSKEKVLIATSKMMSMEQPQKCASKEKMPMSKMEQPNKCGSKEKMLVAPSKMVPVEQPQK